jgi:ribosomal protein L37E
VGSIDSRLRRLEDQGHGACAECGLSPDDKGNIVLIDEENPEKSFQGDPGKRCDRCGRHLYTVIQVVYGE